MNPKWELIRTWRNSGFTLRLYDTGLRHHRGTTLLGYELKDGRKVIFHGSDFSASPMHSDDSDETVCGLLGFLSLRPGDTDREYFEQYTKEQLRWCESSRCDDLNMIQIDMEEWFNAKQCPRCREPFSSRRGVVRSNDGTFYHGRCWSNA